MKESEATKLVALIQGAWPRPPLSKASIGVYTLGLSDLDAAAGQAAVTHLIKTSRWLPTIAEIRSLVVEQSTALPDPEVAWGEVRRAIGSCGMYRSPAFNCPQIAAAVEVIGWREICQSTNVASTRARFVDAYRSIRGRAVEHQAASAGALPAPDDGAQLPRGAGWLLRGDK